MGGAINVAIRFRNGEAICQERWTNNFPFWFKDPKMFSGDEDHVRAYIAMTADNDYAADPHALGRPQPVRNSEYGLIVWDYLTNTILDNNTYSNVGSFDPVHTGGNMLREEFTACANAGLIRMEVFTPGRAGFQDATRTVSERLTPHEAILYGEEAHQKERTSSGWAPWINFLIDPFPMTYLVFMEGAEGTKAMRAKLKELGFPMTAKDGLNRTLPKPPAPRAISEEEKVARTLFQDMKGNEEGKHLRGIKYDDLDGDSKATLLKTASELIANPQLRRSYELAKILGGATRVAILGAA